MVSSRQAADGRVVLVGPVWGPIVVAQGIVGGQMTLAVPRNVMVGEKYE